MMINLDKEIERFEKLASDYEFNLDMHQRNVMKLSVNDIERMKRNAQENRQRAEWLRELKAYRGILSNADKIIESKYGCVIIEDYADVIDKMNEVFKEVNADED